MENHKTVFKQVYPFCMNICEGTTTKKKENKYIFKNMLKTLLTFVSCELFTRHSEKLLCCCARNFVTLKEASEKFVLRKLYFICLRSQ